MKITDLRITPEEKVLIERSIAEDAETGEQPIYGLDPIKDAKQIRKIRALKKVNPDLYNKITNLD